MDACSSNSCLIVCLFALFLNRAYHIVNWTLAAWHLNEFQCSLDCVISHKLLLELYRKLSLIHTNNLLCVFEWTVHVWAAIAGMCEWREKRRIKRRRVNEKQSNEETTLLNKQYQTATYVYIEKWNEKWSQLHRIFALWHCLNYTMHTAFDMFSECKDTQVSNCWKQRSVSDRPPSQKQTNEMKWERSTENHSMQTLSKISEWHTRTHISLNIYECVCNEANK